MIVHEHDPKISHGPLPNMFVDVIHRGDMGINSLYDRLRGGDSDAIPEVYDHYAEMAQEMGEKYSFFCGEHHLKDDIRQSAYLGIGNAINAVLEDRTELKNMDDVVYFRMLDAIFEVFTRNNHFGSESFGRRCRELKRMIISLYSEHHQMPTNEQLASELKWGKASVEVLRLGELAMPLERPPLRQSDPSKEDLFFWTIVDVPLEDSSLLSPDTAEIVIDKLSDESQEHRIHTAAYDALGQIDPFTRDIFERFYGLGDYKEPQNTKQIAQETGESRDNVRQILSRTRRRLQKKLLSPYEATESEPIVDGRF